MEVGKEPAESYAPIPVQEAFPSSVAAAIDATRPRTENHLHEARLLGLEAWQALTGARIERMEGRLTEAHDRLTGLGSEMLTRAAFEESKRHDVVLTWTVGGVVVALISAVIAGFALLPKATSAPPAPVVPIIIQLPAQPNPPAPPHRGGQDAL